MPSEKEVEKFVKNEEENQKEFIEETSDSPKAAAEDTTNDEDTPTFNPKPTPKKPNPSSELKPGITYKFED